MSRTTRVTCSRCHQDRVHQSRGLCRRCYRHIKTMANLDTLPSKRRPIEAVVQVDRHDWVVVDRLMAGVPAQVHPAERDATLRELVRRGMSLELAGRACRMSHTSVRQVLGVAA